MVEPIKLTNREQLIDAAKYNPFLQRAQDLIVDLLTNSCTRALTSEAWGTIGQISNYVAATRLIYRVMRPTTSAPVRQQRFACHNQTAAESAPVTSDYATSDNHGIDRARVTNVYKWIAIQNDKVCDRTNLDSTTIAKTKKFSRTSGGCAKCIHLR